MSRKVLFILKYRENPYDTDTGSYSATWGDEKTGKPLHSGLYNSAKFVVDMLNENGIEAKLVHVIDANHIHREIVKYDATDVVIEAFWVTPEKFKELHQVCPSVRFIVRNHSETPFLANEGMALDWSLQYLKQPWISLSCNSKRATREMRVLWETETGKLPTIFVEDKIPYLPNYYPLKRNRHGKKIDQKCSVIDIGCFGAIRPMKNHLLQAIAAIEFAEKNNLSLNFHVNSGRVEMNGSPILKNLRQMFEKFPKHSLIEHPWQSHEEFMELIGDMDIVMQVSFSETFNIVAADAVEMGVPLLTSKEVSWNSPIFYADPTSSEEMSDSLNFLYKLNRWAPWFRPHVAKLWEHNRNAVRIWTDYFSK